MERDEERGKRCKKKRTKLKNDEEPSLFDSPSRSAKRGRRGSGQKSNERETTKERRRER